MHPTYKRMLAGLEKKQKASRRKISGGRPSLTACPVIRNNGVSLRGAPQGDAAISLCKNKIASPQFLLPQENTGARNDIAAKGVANAHESVPSSTWSLYILKCSDGSFYTGITNDLERRLRMHQAGKASRYTRTRGPVEMLYSETCGNRSSALIRECEVKEWPRTKKEKLVSGKNLKTGIRKEQPARATRHKAT